MFHLTCPFNVLVLMNSLGCFRNGSHSTTCINLVRVILAVKLVHVLVYFSFYLRGGVGTFAIYFYSSFFVGWLVGWLVV